MNITELRKILKNENINPLAYSLSESEPVALENVYCLRVHPDNIEVYGTDRADRLDVQHFDNESDACKSLLTMMSQYHDKRLAKYLR